MSASNPKSKSAPLHSAYEWGGTVARFQRGARTSRAGRRSALLGILTTAYANSNRGGRPSIEGRTSTDRG